MSELERRCRKCNRVQPIEHFCRVQWGGRDYRRHRCRDCTNSYNLSRGRGKTTRAYSVPVYKDPRVLRYKSALNADKAAKRSSDLSLGDYVRLLEQPCFYCERPAANGVDRKDSQIGYLVDNCVPCCVVCNTVLTDMPYEAKLILKSALKEATAVILKDWVPPLKRRKAWSKRIDKGP